MTAYTPPSIADLTDRMLKARSAEPMDAAEPEVEPHEVLNGFRTDPRTAFVDAVAALKLLGVADVPFAVPPEWAGYVQMMPASVAVPMAAGRFPQQVRDLAALLDGEPVHTPTPPAEAGGFSALRSWVRKQANGAGTLAAGIARSLGDEPAVPTGSDAVSANERAAALWTAGDVSPAVKLWLAMPDSPVAWFNRGMCLLFTDRAEEAIPHLRKAVASLPDSSGWQHLAELYLAVAESRV
jgi:tetratricopeptide (TPR) repeat protein